MNKSKPTRRQLAMEKQAKDAARIAVRKAIRDKIRAGLPVYISRNGKIVNLNRKAERPRRKSRPAA